MASKLAGPAVFQEYEIIFIISIPLGCNSALSGKYPLLWYQSFHTGRILTSLNSVFSVTATDFFFSYRIYEV